jgi:hypothetical protein
MHLSPSYNSCHYHKSTSPFHLDVFWFWFLKTKPHCCGVVHIVDHYNCHLWFNLIFFIHLKFIVMLLEPWPFHDCLVGLSLPLVLVFMKYYSNKNPSPSFFCDSFLGHLFYSLTCQNYNTLKNSNINTILVTKFLPLMLFLLIIIHLMIFLWVILKSLNDQLWI